MVPEGLVLLTSVAFAVAAVTLARRKVLVQELPAVEGLARVDVVCLDKTGTLTDGKIVFDRVEPLDGADRRSTVALGRRSRGRRRTRTRTPRFARSPRRSRPTEQLASRPGGAVLVGAQVERGDVRRPRHMGARRARGGPRLTAATMARRRGRRAAKARASTSRRRASGSCSSGTRAQRLEEERLPADVVPRALLLLEEQVRAEAAETLRYFAEQGVAVKIISGDNPRTVAAIARRAGVADQRRCSRRPVRSRPTSTSWPTSSTPTACSGA